MTIGGSKDGATFSLTAEEWKRFSEGKPVIKVSGDSDGIFRVTLKMTRPRSKAKRYPEYAGYAPKKGK